MRRAFNIALCTAWMLLILGLPNCSNNRAPDIDTADTVRPN